MGERMNEGALVLSAFLGMVITGIGCALHFGEGWKYGKYVIGFGALHLVPPFIGLWVKMLLG